MPSTLSEADVCGDVRALLNDTAAQLYSNAAILPYTKIELGELQSYIVQSGLPHLRTWVAITVASTVKVPITRATAGFAEMVEPVKVIGRLTGSTEDYTEIERSKDDLEFENSMIAVTLPTENAKYWKWADGQLQIGPSSTSRDYRVQIYRNITPYPYGLTTGYTFTDLVDFREYLSHRIAALMAGTIGQNMTRASALANKAVGIGESIKGRMIKSEQALPARRRGFWSGRKRIVVR